MTPAACTHRDDAAAYVLGALPEVEGATFARHLAGCADCHRQVEELQFVAETLPMAAAPLQPPSTLRDRVMAVVHSEADVLRAAGPSADRPPDPGRRRRSRRLPRLGSLRSLPAAALAAVLLALGVGTGLLVDGGPEPPRTLAADVDDAVAPGGTAVLRLEGDDGTLAVSKLPPPPEGRIYQVWVKRRAHQAPDPTAALFGVTGKGDAVVEVPGDLEDVQAVLVTDEPLGGSNVPTRTPIVRADIG